MTRCKRCGGRVTDIAKKNYGKFCTWTCLSLWRKEQEAILLAKRELKRKEKPKTGPRKKPKPYERSSRAVLQYTTDGELIRRHQTVRDAAEAVGVNKTSIYGCCSGRYQMCRGFVWKYE